MVTGKQPFVGDYEQAVIYSIMNEDPDPPTALRTGVPMEFERIVTKALAKNPDERYQSTNEMLVDLHRIQKTISSPTELSPIALPGTQRLKKTRFRFRVIGIILLVAMLSTYYLFDRYTTADEDRGQPGRKMLAVLPFENLGAPEDEYFADGITEEIMSRLAAIEGLGIISRTSVIHYKRTQKNVTEIAEELNVGYILAGTIRWDRASESPSRVRVTPQLIRVSDDINLWSDRYDAILNDIFQVQSDIAKRVSEELGIVLLEQQLRSLESQPTANLAAYDYYLRGIDYSNRGEELLSEHHFQIATQMYERAIDLDSTFALAYARLSIAHNLLYRYHFDRTDETLAKQRLAAKKALQLAPHLPEAHLAMGYYFRDQLDYDQALKQFEIVLQGKPNDVEAVAAIGVIQRHQGKWEQAVSNLSRAVELNPRIGSLSCTVGGICLAMRNYDDADRHHQRAALLSPDRACPYYCMAWIYLSRDGDTEKTRTFLNKLSPNVGLEDSPPVNYPWVTIDLIDGKYEDALNRLASGSSEAYEFWFYYIPKSQLYAQTYGLLNQKNLEQVYYDSARSLLERKIRERPRDARLHSALGIAYAGLGRKQEAIQEGLFATELLPASKDLWLGTHRLKDLAHIYVMVDEYEQAIDQLEFLLSIPSYFSEPLFRMDPIWTPLRSHSRFQKLLQKEE
jgi:serine/threonine-protein kinase